MESAMPRQADPSALNDATGMPNAVQSHYLSVQTGVQSTTAPIAREHQRPRRHREWCTSGWGKEREREGGAGKFKVLVPLDLEMRQKLVCFFRAMPLELGARVVCGGLGTSEVQPRLPVPLASCICSEFRQTVLVRGHLFSDFANRMGGGV
jgi:hypothetical protein